MGMRFSKMQGIGNDFVIVDCRERPLALDTAQIRRLGDRHFGVGFDQLLTIERARDAGCSYAYSIWNTDGTTSEQCGNGVRCVASWLARAGLFATGAPMMRLQSPSGPVAIELLDDGRVRADMGEPRFDAPTIPFVVHAHDCAGDDLYQVDVAGHSVELGAVSMGNPHAVIEVADIESAAVESLGPQVEHSGAFPQGCNVGFAQVVSRSTLRLRVWERGVGETLACGSGACAAVALLRRRGRLDERVRVALPGGELVIEWAGEGSPMWMTGPTAFVFEGEWND